ncbi:MAG: hypothetical protein IJ558_11360 [Treponema sp.]|nr:hypothetical protein [Treponema sp.]
MKRASTLLKNLFFVFFCGAAGIFLSSCGLEEVIVVDEPTVTYNDPLYSSTEYLTWYHSFKTSNDSGDSFIGTDVYYKIYNNSSSLTSQRASILNVNTTSNGSAAATRMIETYSYQQLGASASTGNSVYFPSTERNRTVVFRLKTYANADAASANNDDRYTMHACVGVKQTNATKYDYRDYIPFRNGNAKSFDFFDDDDDDDDETRDVEPVEGDADYYYTATASEDDTYYVQLFAVGVAFDSSSVSNSYSLVLDLGSVPIRKNQ